MLGMKPKDPTAEALQLQRQRESELTKARTDLAAAEAARAAKPEATDTELDALDDAVRRAATLVTRAEDRHRLAAQRYDEACEAKAASELEARQKAARAKAAEVTKVIARRQTEASLAFLTLLRDMAEAAHALQAAGLEDPRPELVVRSRRAPEKILSDEVVELWAYPNDNNPFPPERQREVVVDRNDATKGTLRHIYSGPYTHGPNTSEVHLKKFRMKKSLPAVRNIATDLASALALPPLFGSGGDIWTPLSHSDPDTVIEKLEEAIARLEQQMEQAKTKDIEREPVVTLTLLKPVSSSETQSAN